MRLLVLGGTQFVGRAVAEAALERGHELTLFNRGRTNPGLFPDAEHLTGDRFTNTRIFLVSHIIRATLKLPDDSVPEPSAPAAPDHAARVSRRRQGYTS